jgi:large subunit ribosomal protein L10
MPKTKIQKQNTVSELTDKVKSAKSLVFADYQGLTMGQLSELRKSLREQKAEFSVTKNTLLKIALREANIKASDEAFLQGPVATLFAYDDEITPIKALVKALKDAQKGKVKAGFLGDNYLDQNRVQALANLPSKLELQAQVVGVLVAPIRGIVTVLNGNLRNLAVVLDQIRQQKGGE